MLTGRIHNLTQLEAKVPGLRSDLIGENETSKCRQSEKRCSGTHVFIGTGGTATDITKS